jgi:hypothetical protein
MNPGGPPTPDKPQEVGQSTGLLVGKQAEIRPEDLPAEG